MHSIIPPSTTSSTASTRKNTGRWTEEECAKFMLAFEEFGGNWKMIAKRIGTRTNIQCRTHGQKMVATMQGGGEGGASLDASPKTPPQPVRADAAATLRIVEAPAPKLHRDGKSIANNAMFRPLPPPWLMQPQCALPSFGTTYSLVPLPPQQLQQQQQPIFFGANHAQLYYQQ